ncbi:MAG: UDP-N-acetylmuramoyl-tripeptide--D-alanyl-D-alanine ligase [Planctomycetota bacterium]|jgi:UDP-N-acetylmuramoyl-tripeptide--D-alanyl-D-alanine ligase
MEQLSIRKVAAWTGGTYDGPDMRVSGIAIDSRKAGRGDLFLPLRGAMHDGHEFIGEAFASGATAALVDRPDVAKALDGLGRAIVRVPDVRKALAELASAYRDHLDLKVVGITGSNGKTTTKEMLRVILGARAAVSPRSYNNDLGVPLTLLSATRHHRFCVVEMGTNALGEIGALARIARPDVGVVLNVSESHLSGLGDLDGVAEEKGALVKALPRDGCAVLNWDDLRVREMMDDLDCYTLTFGTWDEADVFGSEIKTRGRGLSFRALSKKLVRLQTYGVHNVHNALAAATTAMWLGEHACEVFERLEAFRPVPMRMAVEDVGRIRLINDAYNANPRSVEAAILEMSVRAGSRRIAVLGDMLELGDRAIEYHERIGRAVAQSSIDKLWAIGPLSEATARAARNAGLRSVHWSPDVPAALEEPPFGTRSGDVVLFKASRGVRLERVYEAVRERARSRRSAPVQQEKIES